ncbi:TetR family transcriptional regulator [Chromobacterium haemolyticum]|nr:TetR family transcriptional regulator [Chromobacterium haemolyticum]
MRHVRVSLTAAQQAEQAPPATRRRPRQSRSRASLIALQQAFVQVLLERGYAKTTVREVAAVAGVAVGTFYQYVRNMDAWPR